MKEWISNKVGTFRPLTQYYFQKYSLAANEQPKTFDEFLRAGPLDDDISIEKFLIKVSFVGVADVACVNVCVKCFCIKSE